MPGSELMELIRSGRNDDFELRCLELLEEGRLTLPALIAPVEELDRRGQSERLVALVDMVFQSVAPESDPPAGLALARLALAAAPQREDLRRRVLDLYRAVHGQSEGFELILQASGLAGGRPVRQALKLLDLGLALRSGDALISRTDGRVVEVVEIDRVRGLFTLRREGRTTTMPAGEVARDYDRVAADDFRVLRELRPEQLTQQVHDDPVAVVIGLIHAHGERIDADLLKQELVPRFLPAGEWSRWWTRTRGLLKRNPHVVVEGRSPVTLRYTAEALTLEDETWAVVERHKEPLEWLADLEAYLREKAEHKEAPSSELLRRFDDRLRRHAATVRPRRPAEALGTALVLHRLSRKGVALSEEARGLAESMLREADDPGRLLKELTEEGLRELGLEVLRTARPQDWLGYALGWLPTASATLLDALAAEAVAGGHTQAVQAFIDRGLSDPVHHPELLMWLWKGPSCTAALRLPSDEDLFRLILDTVSELGRSITASADAVREFRQRMRSALGHRDYAKAGACLSKLSAAAAITVRRQLQRIEGLGENVPARLLDLLRDVHPQLWAAPPRQVAPWEDRETLWCTPEGLHRRTAERDEVVNVKMPENAKRIGEAASHGDLSENSEYKFALEERDLLRARVAAINDELSRARTLSPYDVPTDYVGIGSRVTLRRLTDGQERVMTFLGPFETDVEQGIYSYLAPVSQKLMGARVGERVTLVVDGRETEFEVVALGNALAKAARPGETPVS
ncbi:MAG: GreA/GreB family elongation factor [Planctomycetota bacterium]